MQARLDAGHAVRNLREVAAAEFLLPLHAEGAVIGRDHLQIVIAQAAPQMFMVMLGAERRRADVFGALELAFTLSGWLAAQIVLGEKEVLRAGLGVGGQAAIARLHDAL